jgi:hypothetical protein
MSFSVFFQAHVKRMNAIQATLVLYENTNETMNSRNSILMSGYCSTPNIVKHRSFEGNEKAQIILQKEGIYRVLFCYIFAYESEKEY